jgi:hypothetical protein
VADGLEAYLPLTDMVDIGKEVERLNKQASKLQLDLDSSMKRLSSTKVRRPFVLHCKITNLMDCPSSGFDVGRCSMNLISCSLQADAHNLNIEAAHLSQL